VALYRIRRDVGVMSDEDMDAAAFRAIVCLVQFPGLKWERSYWDRSTGSLDCYYRAESIDQIQEHSRVARIPCDDVRPVDELLPDTYLNG
jgi:hypothetical protein